MTEIKAIDGKLYVSAIFDCFDLAVLGLAMDTNMKATLCEKTVENAYKAYQNIRGGILYSDRRTQYTSEQYRNEIKKYGIQQSMNSAGGRCHDNARGESMWARLKEELLYDRYDTTKMTIDEIKTLIWRYFISYWNNRRICSANGGLPPMIKRQRMKQKNGTYLPPPLSFHLDIKKKHIGYNVILEVNEIEAATVQSVFQAHADEITIYAIVKKLNEENQHNRSWTQNFVSRMLKNPFYKGTYLAGKTKKLFDSSLVFRNPMDSWIKIENYHEAIITADLFDKVQNIFQTKRSMLSQIIRSKKIVYPEKYTAHIAPRKCDALCNVRPQPILEVQGFYVK